MPHHSENQLLSSLPETDLATLQPHLESVEFRLRKLLEIPREKITDVYFPLTGILSVVAVAPKGLAIETGMIGNDGMTGVAVLLGDAISSNRTLVQIAGEGLRIPTEILARAVENSCTMREHFLRYAFTSSLQAAHTALANGRGTIQARLARWLLMVLDRVGRQVNLTHDSLATMLGVRRAGVTTALATLEIQAAIERRRGHIVVLDRARLETLAAGLYGIPEAEQSRLLGWNREPL